MRRWLRGGRLAGLIVLAALLSLVGTIAFKRMRGPDAAQARALAQLRMQPPAPGLHNAWPWLWLLDYAVPAADVDAVYAADRQSLQGRIALSHGEYPDHYVSVAAKHFVHLPKLSYRERQMLCTARDENCVDKARAHKAAWRTVLRRHARRLQRIQALSGFDAEIDTMAASAYPLAPSTVDIQRLWLSDAALHFVDGDREAGLAEVCTSAATWRRLRGHDSALITQSLAEWAVREATQVLAQMLAETPDDTPLPEVCSSAYAPATALDVDRCPAARASFARFAASLEQTPPWMRHRLPQRLPGWLLARQATLAAAAPSYAWVCTASVRQRLLDDGPFGHAGTAPQPVLTWMDWLANPLGAEWLRDGLFDYSVNLDRAEDYASTLRLMRLRLWLRTPEARAWPVAQRLQTGLSTVGGLQRRDVSFDPDGHHLRMGLYQPTQSGKERVFPLSAASGPPR